MCREGNLGMRTEIVYEDNAVLVVYKPAGLATQTASVERQDVVSELKNYIRQTGNRTEKNMRSAPYLGVIHRLDQPVEGLLVFAKNPKAAAGLNAQLQKRKEEAGFCKHYYAVLYGRPAETSGALEDYLRKKDGRAEIEERQSGITMCPDARRARLQYSILQTVDLSEIALADIRTDPGGGNQTGARMAHGEIALADIRLETGRFHQIRAQMAHGGTPLLGDLKYGNKESIEAGRKLNVRNVALCAYQLEFLHPVTGKKLDFHIKPRGEIFSLFSQF